MIICSSEVGSRCPRGMKLTIGGEEIRRAGLFSCALRGHDVIFPREIWGSLTHLRLRVWVRVSASPAAHSCAVIRNSHWLQRPTPNWNWPFGGSAAVLRLRWHRLLTNQIFTRSWKTMVSLFCIHCHIVKFLGEDINIQCNIFYN